jgi:serine protease Do
MSFADLVARLQPAVVNISTKQRVPVKAQQDPFEEFFRRFDPTQPQGNDNSGGGSSGGGGGGSGGAQPRTREAGSLGSGFIVSPDGYIVTNNHLIQGLTGTGTVDTVTVTTTDRREYSARIIGRDETSDLALLKIDGRNLPFVQWGDSTKARVGDRVIAIGDPYGVGSTVTAGIVSALHRGITGVGAYDRYIQTDAAINMGNSGGPMFDLNGNVIGINSALIADGRFGRHTGLAIPAEAAKPVIDALMKGQRPSRGYARSACSRSMKISRRRWASQGCGETRPIGRLRRPWRSRRPGPGRRDREVNGQQVTPDQTVSYLVANTAVGARVPLEIIRGGGRDRNRAGRGTADRRAAGEDFRRRCRNSGRFHCGAGDSPARAWPLAGAADAGPWAGRELAGDGPRRGHYGRRPERQRGGAGPSAR